ncbi:MAG: hypothetical protein WBV36_05950 [Terriglobales bacterium]
MRVLVAIMVWPAFSHAENLEKEIKKAVERSTLDQPSTKPFHLKATLAPSFERDRDSGRTGEVEIWWASPSKWKRELKTPGFHRVEIVDGDRRWEKNDGDFFPEWLREVALELVKPIPALDEVLEHAKTAERVQMGPTTNLNWITDTGTAEVHNIRRSWVAVQNNTSLLLYGGGFGWSGGFEDYASFHGRMVARTVTSGGTEVTAKVTVLEDLGDASAGLFDAVVQGGDPQPLQTVLIDETTLRKNLLPMDPISWPPLQDGSLQGNFTTDVVVDRDGKVRELGTNIAENNGVIKTGEHAVESMRFKPFVINGVSVQVMSQITVPFKIVRPTGIETFESPQTFFERGRHASFPAASQGTPYILRAEFDARTLAGNVEKGRYEDTWLSETQWRREAWLASSHYVRSRNGDKSYQFAEGPDAGTLRIVFRALEPIPALDTFQESDWRIKHDPVNGANAIRVLTGYESPEGKFDVEQVRAFWFDNNGLLLKSYFKGIESQRSEFEDFNGIKIAHRIDLLKDGKLGMRIRVTEIAPAASVPPKTFEVPKHEWTRAFTDEAR